MDFHFFVTLRGSNCVSRIYFCFSGNSDKVCHCVTCGQPQLGEAYRCQKNSDSWTLWKSRGLRPGIHPQSKWFLKIAKLSRQGQCEKKSKNWISLIEFILKIHKCFLEILGWSDHSDSTKCIFKRAVCTNIFVPGYLGIMVTRQTTVLLYFCGDKRQIWLFFKDIVSL